MSDSKTIRYCPPCETDKPADDDCIRAHHVYNQIISALSHISRSPSSSWPRGSFVRNTTCLIFREIDQHIYRLRARQPYSLTHPPQCLKWMPPVNIALFLFVSEVGTETRHQQGMVAPLVFGFNVPAGLQSGGRTLTPPYLDSKRQRWWILHCTSASTTANHNCQQHRMKLKRFVWMLIGKCLQIMSPNTMFATL